MAEITALRKYPCPECGGDAEWNASKQALVCPYCGTIVPWTPGKDALGETIRETELAAAFLNRSGANIREEYHWRSRSRTCGSESRAGSTADGVIASRVVPIGTIDGEPQNSQRCAARDASKTLMA